MSSPYLSPPLIPLCLPSPPMNLVLSFLCWPHGPIPPRHMSHPPHLQHVRILGLCLILLIGLFPVNSLLDCCPPSLPLLPSPVPRRTLFSSTLQISTQQQPLVVSFPIQLMCLHLLLCVLVLHCLLFQHHFVSPGNHRTSRTRSPAGASGGCCLLPQGSPWSAQPPVSTFGSSPFSPTCSPTEAPSTNTTTTSPLNHRIHSFPSLAPATSSNFHHISTIPTTSQPSQLQASFTELTISVATLRHGLAVAGQMPPHIYLAGNSFLP